MKSPICAPLRFTYFPADAPQALDRESQEKQPGKVGAYMKGNPNDIKTGALFRIQPR